MNVQELYQQKLTTAEEAVKIVTVSYTHLTLPTKLEV